jgi:predicted DCC family thiol-disulfide oxidoreductase YuxK
LNGVDSVIWYDPTRELVLVRSSAVLRVLKYLGGSWRALGAIGRVVPRFLRDSVYDLVAKHRHKLIRGAPACVVPTPEERARFLD